MPVDLQPVVALVREFVARDVQPRWREIEEHDAIPPELLSRAAGVGLFGLSIPTAYGGLGLGLLGKALVHQELGRGHAGFASLVGLHSGLATAVIALLGTDQQKETYLPRMATGELLGAFGLTEPGAGSDAASIRTRAERREYGWVLNGTKHFITNAAVAQLFTIFAVTDPSKGTRGISAFLVPRDAPGFRVGRVQATMGLRGSHVAELVLEECAVPVESMLGAEGAGYGAALGNVAHGRITLAARCVGAAERVTELATRYAQQREQFGQPIAEFQLIRAQLADMAAETAAARMLAYYAAWLVERGQPARKEAAMAKLVGTETYGRVVDRAVQVFGGMGYTKDVEVEHFYRDARITRIYEGTSEIQKLIMARELLKESA